MEIAKKKTMVRLEPISRVLHYQTPSVQRLLDDTHVQRIVDDQVREFRAHGSLSALQSITCAEFENRMYVLDGQHRIEAFRILRDQRGVSLDDVVPVVSYLVSTEVELQEYYSRINNHTPISPLELENSWMNQGKQFFAWFTKKYSDYVKKQKGGSRCPNISLHETMEYFNTHKVFERATANGDLGALIKATESINDYLVHTYTGVCEHPLQDGISSRVRKCLEKTAETKCVLGIWRKCEWIEIAIHMMRTGHAANEVRYADFLENRPKIPRRVRMAVWHNRHENTTVGHCFVCQNELLYDDMECGHIVAHAQGGDCCDTNLEPVCRICNRDMGVMNMNDYIKLLRP
jgi:5-methylcytosine-specific restriction endonuclease McrA